MEPADKLLVFCFSELNVCLYGAWIVIFLSGKVW